MFMGARPKDDTVLFFKDTGEIRFKEAQLGTGAG
jgi:hypothetical protein